MIDKNFFCCYFHFNTCMLNWLPGHFLYSENEQMFIITCTWCILNIYDVDFKKVSVYYNQIFPMHAWKQVFTWDCNLYLHLQLISLGKQKMVHYWWIFPLNKEQKKKKRRPHINCILNLDHSCIKISYHQLASIIYCMKHDQYVREKRSINLHRVKGLEKVK